MKRPGRQSPVRLALCGGTALCFLLLVGFGFAPLQEAEWSAQDWRMRLGRKAAVDPRLVLIGIDRPSYSEGFNEEEVAQVPALAHLQERFPWSREVWATLIDKLVTAGAKVVVLDLVFAGPGEGDEALRQTLDKYRQSVVIGSSISDAETERGNFWRLALPHPEVLNGTEGVSLALDERVGFVNIWPDPDQTLRRAAYRLTNRDVQNVIPAGPDAVIESLAARALRAFGRADLLPDGSELRCFRFAGPPGAGYRPHPVGDVLAPKVWQNNYKDGEFFRDKIVLIGPTDARSFHDDHATPFAGARMVGPEIHLNIIGATLAGELLRETSGWTGLFLIAIAGLTSMGLSWWISQPIKRLGLTCLAGAGYLVGTQLLFDYGNIAALTISPLGVLLLSGILILAHDFISERAERLRLRTTMSYYFSPRVLEEVLTNPGSMQPREAEVTVLLTDLRNSTPLAETLGPEGMFKLLNRVFEVQTTAIMSEEGNLEHFLGDQFLSYWGAPQEQPDAPERALQAARKLIAAMEELKASLEPNVRQLFGYGVALHSGRVLCGNKGSAMRLDYGLVGDTINEAARVESLTKYYGAMFLVTGETLAGLKNADSIGAQRLIDRVIVKGKSGAVELSELSHSSSPKNFAELSKAYEEAYSQYTAGNFQVARAQFTELATNFSDGPSRVLAERCELLLAEPHESWAGIWKMESK